MNPSPAPHDHEPAYVLHTYPFRDTSVIVEAFTLSFGRIGLVARGARRPKSRLRGALIAFQPLAVSWSGRGELRTLTDAEPAGAIAPLGAMAMMCGYYLNELVLKLTHRDDPHEQLFADYAHALGALAQGETPATVLRRFEVALLREIGYALVLDREPGTNRVLEPQARYVYVPDRGPVALDRRESGTSGLELTGKTLLDMANGNFSDPVTASESKALMRWLIGLRLDQRTLNTRRMLIELQQIE